MTTYVYGVVPAEVAAPSGPGIDGAALELVTDDGLAALVSDLPDEEPGLGREAIAAHAAVLEQALAAGTVLPMRFGVVMPDASAVREHLLTRHRDELRDQLAALTGKVELRLRATYDEPRLMREIVAENADIARLRASLGDAPPDATYYARIQLGELVAAAVDRHRAVDADAIVGALEPLALATRVADVDHERVVVSASFLVARDQITAFDGAVDEVGRRYAGRIRFKYTGPLPPHSFVRLTAEA